MVLFEHARCSGMSFAEISVMSTHMHVNKAGKVANILFQYAWDKLTVSRQMMTIYCMCVCLNVTIITGPELVHCTIK